MNRFQVTPVNHVENIENIENGVYNHSYVNDEVQINLNNLNRNYPRTSTTSSSNNTTTAINHPSRKFSLAQLTSEVLPRLDNYRQSFKSLKRPSLGKLHGDHTENVEIDKDAEAPDPKHTQGIKLGWIQGVLIPCLLNIWGVMLFLRLSWVVAQAGIGHSMLIIAMSAVVCVITTLSLSAISTNGEVKGGGIYFIISRSLGPEFGASVGIVFAFANAVAASMNTIGFCNSLNDLLKTYDVKIVDGDVNDVRIVGVVAIAVMIVICAVGMEWESKAQNFLIAIIVAAIFNFLIGTLIGPKSEEAISKGFEGFNNQLFATNWVPDYRMAEGVEQGFFSVFAIFFPSVTGIQAGANISGDLRDPASSIPKGTLLSLLISMASYASFVIFAGGAAVRDASGNTTDLINGSLIGVDLNCVDDGGCTFGLHNSYSVMQLMSVWWPLIYAGCFAATLSTALTNLLSVPRLIQALGIDRIYPGVIFFSKGYGKHGEPYRGYVLTFFISSLFLLIAELNVIAPLISNFYLASYALINFCTFHAAFIKPLGWRPTFKYYNVWLSLFGFFLCVGIMFLIDWLSSVITFVIIIALYLIVVYRKPDVNWGSSTQAQTYKTALLSAYKLQHIDDHVKNYRPQILVLSGTPLMRPPLLDLANLITKNNSLMIVGDIATNNISYKARKEIAKEAQAWLAARKIKAFYKLIIGFDFEQGVNALIQSSGIGKLSPNLLLMGYKADWRTCNKKDLLSYFNILHKAFNNRLSVTILRLPNGLDYSHLTTEINPLFKHSGGLITANSSTSNLQQLALPLSDDISSLKPPLVSQIMHADSYLNLAKIPSPNTTLTDPNAMPPMPNQKKIALNMARNESIVYSTVGGSTVPKEVLDALNVLTKKKNISETIDVWWLYDDGGLTMLLPYIIHMRSNWSNCSLRVFALTNQTMELEVEERNMSNLLTKLRIPYSSLIMLQGVTNKPSLETIQRHSNLLDGFHEGENSECFVSDTEILTLEEKTHRQLRLRELLMEHSSNAALIVMSLPMPRQDAVSAPLYMSWLEMLTKDMPPLMLVRGNQNSVLTCYS